jgi:hypothetical protein
LSRRSLTGNVLFSVGQTGPPLRCGVVALYVCQYLNMSV